MQMIIGGRSVSRRAGAGGGLLPVASSDPGILAPSKTSAGVGGDDDHYAGGAAYTYLPLRVFSKSSWRLSDSQQRWLLLVLLVYVVLGMCWLKVLIVENHTVERRMLERQAALTQTMAAAQTCDQSRIRLIEQYREQKEQQRLLRRERNSLSLESKRKERICQAELEEILGHRKQQLDFTALSLQAKLHGTTEAFHFRMEEALAKIQNVDGFVVHLRQLSGDDLRNGIISELAFLLSKPVSELQSTTNANLLDMVGLSYSRTAWKGRRHFH